VQAAERAFARESGEDPAADTSSGVGCGVVCEVEALDLLAGH
jgi:hypothetical protein